MLTVPYRAVTGTHFGKHVERAAVQPFVLILFGNFKECRYKGFVESETGNVTACIYTEAVDTHGYKLRVTIYQIVIYGRIFGIQVNAVAGYLSEPSSGFVPVPSCA